MFQSRAAVAVAALCVALAAGTAVASAQPAGVVAPSLDLRGAVNARDIGGYLTSDGSIVLHGLVYRSNALNDLTPADLATLRRHHVVVIEDLRSAYERALEPDRVPAGAVDRWNDVLGLSVVPTIIRPASAYTQFVASPEADRAFGNVLRDIIHTNGAVLYHCSEGKDRTGWMTAVLLTILGVNRADVDRDFLLSDQYLHAAPGNTLTGVTLDELNSSFALANKMYGSFDNYVHRGLGLSNADIAALKDKLTARVAG